MKISGVIFTFLILSGSIFAQRIPNEVENIDYLITYGKDAPSSTGDDDHVQTFFFIIPENFDSPFYVRVYDPEAAGSHDEPAGSYNTKTRFSIYGGAGTITEDSRNVNPVGNYKGGNIMATKVFGNELTYDSKWYAFGPFNPSEGEYSPDLKGKILKIITEGVTGDDGNAYRYFLSINSSKNIPIDGANAFTYEYTFKLPMNKGISHLYPFIDRSVVSLTQHNFDFDSNGEIFLYSVAKNRHEAKGSGDNQWLVSKHMVEDSEKNTTIDLQIVKSDGSPNAMSVYVLNQYRKAIAFFSAPIGGPPKFKYDPSITFKKN